MKNLKKVIIPVALAATLSLSAFLASCGDDPGAGDGDKWRDEKIWMTAEALVPTSAAQFPEDIAFERADNGSVHDPSIFHDPESGYYYAYGTHYAVAKTYDFEYAYASERDGGWEQVAEDGKFEVLYGKESFTHESSGKEWPEAIRETVELVNPGSDSRYSTTDTTWAPDVEYIDGKYYMYYSLTRGFGSRESAIARVESDSPEGPFANNQILLDSMGGGGATPNCIDPELFYDKEGKLWMVYGSTYGGIYIIELNTDGDKVGLPKEEGYGKIVWRATDNVEGPFVYYNAATDYYYLMTSYGSLTTNYNMHVARSKNPDGPYTGVDGKDVAVDGNGNQVSSNFKMARGGNGSDKAYAAMGHNSVIKDKDGKYYCISHMRRFVATAANATQGTVEGGHLIYVNQIYFNEEGWPVLAPTVYTGETRGTMTETEVAKEYDVVLHVAPKSISLNPAVATFTNSSVYTLTADGKVTGSGTLSADSWTLKQNYYIELTINGKAYKGVVAPGWDTYTLDTSKQKAVVTISAVAADGTALWAVEK